MQKEGTKILLIAFLLESALALIFFVWAWKTDFRDALYPGFGDLCAAFGFAIFLCAINIVLFHYLARRYRYFDRGIYFIDTFVKPLADSLSIGAAVLVSVFAGVGEELFFRGVLQNEIGLLAASALFSFFHFGTAIKSFWSVGVLYFLFGLSFGLLYQFSATLWVPLLAHAIYDFLALMYLRFFYTKSLGQELDCLVH